MSFIDNKIVLALLIIVGGLSATFSIESLVSYYRGEGITFVRKIWVFQGFEALVMEYASLCLGIAMFCIGLRGLIIKSKVNRR